MIEFRWRRWLAIPLLLVAPAWASEGIAELEDDFNKAQEAFYKGAQGNTKVDWTKHPAREFLPKFKAWAEDHAGKPEAVPALVWILRNGQGAGESGKKSAVSWALDRLAKDHAGDPGLKDALGSMMYLGWEVGDDRMIDFYESVLERNRDDDVLAGTNFNLAFTLYNRSQKEGGPREGGAGKAQQGKDRKRAIALFRKVATEFKESKSAERAQGYIYEIENLQIGMKAPEIVGKDVKGREIKLSDFRGRVVVVDFWGFW